MAAVLLDHAADDSRRGRGRGHFMDHRRAEDFRHYRRNDVPRAAACHLYADGVHLGRSDWWLYPGVPARLWNGNGRHPAHPGYDCLWDHSLRIAPRSHRILRSRLMTTNRVLTQ